MKKYKNYYVSTLRLHVEKCHPSVYPEIVSPTKRHYTSNIGTNTIEIRKLLVELVSSCGRPLKIIKDVPLRKILKMAANSDSDLFSMEQLLSDICNISKQVQNHIMYEVKGKHVSLMIDTTTRFGKSVLGINIQFIHHDQLKVRCLGMIRLRESHTGVYMAQMVEANLREYGIELDQIYSMTTDNASNMRKTHAVLREYLKKGHNGRDEDIEVMNNDDVDEILFDEEEVLQFLLGDEGEENALNQCLLNEEPIERNRARFEATLLKLDQKKQIVWKAVRVACTRCNCL